MKGRVLIPIGRLAPSPTGAQHLGNARTFLIAWLSIRQKSGKLILRMEDLDTPRTKPGASEQAIEDLKWLGLDWDAEPGQENGFPPLIQSHRLSRYEEVFKRLQELELVYPCTCTRSDVESAQSAPHELGIEPRYPGTCSHRRVSDAIEMDHSGQSFSWRFRIPNRTIAWLDGFHGLQSMNPFEQLGDFVIRRSNGAPAYQLAVVVDDRDMQISEVIRGADLIPSTYRQIAIYEAMDWTPPSMIHLPLVVGPDGRRLAKRHGDTRLATMRQCGIRPETILGYFAEQHGWISSFRPMRARELLDIAHIESISREPLCFASPDAIDYFRKLQFGV